MTEQELRDRLNSLTEAIPDETHRSFLMAASPGKDETVMNVIDLTHVISPDMPVYPGTEGPKLSPANTYEKDGFKETLLSMYSHTGTHMDPPAHIFAGRTTLDQFPAEQFIGKALVINCRELKEGDSITLEHIRKYGKKAQQADFLLFNLGWDRY